MKISVNGLKIIKRFEGLKLKPYLCPAGVPTIGYGNTYYEDGRKVSLNDEAITKERASELLKNIVNQDFVPTLNKHVRVPLNQYQFDALASFIYNVGPGNFRTSTLLKLLNRADYYKAANEFKKWRRSGGKILRGLVRRRKIEKELFIKEA